MTTGLLSAQDALRYWDQRHRAEGDMRSGGDVTFDEHTNHIMYAVRLAMLLDIIGHQSSDAAPLFILDAGCGKGWFTRRLAGFGHWVDGIDASESAIAYCRQRSAGPNPRYTQSTLSMWRSPWLYDVVISIDVLFHILDDEEWAASVRNIGSSVRIGGKLIVADWGGRGDQVYGNYQVVRGRDRYVPLLTECGMRFDGWRPMAFRATSFNGFYIFTQTA